MGADAGAHPTVASASRAPAVPAKDHFTGRITAGTGRYVADRSAGTGFTANGHEIMWLTIVGAQGSVSVQASTATVPGFVSP